MTISILLGNSIVKNGNWKLQTIINDNKRENLTALVFKLPKLSLNRKFKKIDQLNILKA